jgi:hypothetical protein
MSRNHIGIAALMASTLALLSVPALAQTAPAPTPPPLEAVVNPCTGTDEAKCGTLAACTWLPGFKIQGAADVPGYCRTAPKSLTARRPDASAPAAPPAVKQ